MKLYPDPQAQADPQAEALLRFNRDVLDQALALVAAHEAPGAPPYAQPVGAHLRHVIEHYEALLMPARPNEVDYDRRARDAELESCPGAARRRLCALQLCLQHWQEEDLHRPLSLRGQAGLAGEFAFAVESSVGRELVFLASHAVHHYALLKLHCQQHGMRIAADFGKAPATVAHERAALSNTTTKETACTPLAALA